MCCPLQTTFSLMRMANIFLSCVSFQQRTTGVGCPARRLTPSPTVSGGPQNGAPAPTAVAQVSQPAPQTGTGLAACRPRPGCARSGRARLCSGGCSRSVHNPHTFIGSEQTLNVNTFFLKFPPMNVCTVYKCFL